MTIKEIRTSMGLSQQQFADYFEIPVKTIQDWEQGRREPPDYIPKLLERVWMVEKGIEDNKITK